MCFVYCAWIQYLQQIHILEAVVLSVVPNLGEPSGRVIVPDARSAARGALSDRNVLSQ